MKEIVKYDLIGCQSHKEFVKMVESAIKDGYQPLGSAFINLEDDTQMYYQTMVKYA
jgi:hypothetical protein